MDSPAWPSATNSDLLWTTTPYQQAEGDFGHHAGYQENMMQLDMTMMHTPAIHGIMAEVQDTFVATFPNGSSTPLLAELAELGLDIASFLDADPKGTPEGSLSDDYSSSARTAEDSKQCESNFQFQATSSLDISELDDSLLSSRSGAQSNSRWIHGKDTPPSSPAPSFASRTGSSVSTDQQMSKVSSSTSMSYSYSTPFSLPDEFGVMQEKNSRPSSEWSSSWPRIPLAQSDASNRQAVLNERTSSSVSLHERRAKQHSRKRSSRSEGLLKRSSDSMTSDAGPSRPSRVILERIDSQRAKTMSASVISEQEARRVHQEKQCQFDQVSHALDTLRRFLRQREDSMSIIESSFAASTRHGGALVPEGHASSMLAKSYDSMNAAFSLRQRTLRHPPTGPLPPRGSVCTSPEELPTVAILPLQEGSRVEAERIAALDSLAKKVRQMKDDNQQMLDLH